MQRAFYAAMAQWIPPRILPLSFPLMKVAKTSHGRGDPFQTRFSVPILESECSSNLFRHPVSMRKIAGPPCRKLGKSESNAAGIFPFSLEKLQFERFPRRKEAREIFEMIKPGNRTHLEFVWPTRWSRRAPGRRSRRGWSRFCTGPP